MLSVDPVGGLVILYGIYPLFSIKSALFCIIAGVAGGLMVILDKKCKNVFRGFLTRFLIASLTGFVFYGLLKDYFNLEPKEYMAAIMGFLSFPIFNWLFENMDEIASSILIKIFKKAGVDVMKKQDKDEQKDA